ncbi:TolC family protein [Pedobacter metabolipauper]|uniref:Outer membrane protein TolC n=1 Tax=Pedobacter metabolipauper TaxID=425513 RepID=A0A4R6SY44_9SPHI|nr:TolC family protein [Pedobacter metabolipauper]TDQ10932.1 outer membrane protein TolC [Pedobacter metabolipauper]
MKLNVFTRVWILAAVLIPASLSAQTPLQKYLEEAITNNLELQNRDFAVQKSLYALKEAKGLFLPDVNFNTQYLASGGGRKIEIPIGDLLNPVYSTLNNLTSSGQFPQVENVSQSFNPNNFYDAKVHTTLPLYNAEIIFNTKIKKEQINIRQAELNVYKRELIKNVKLAYYGYLQSLSAIEVLNNGIVLAKENLRINEAMVKNGKAIRTVVNRAENEVTGLKAQLEDARSQALNAAAYFNFLLNKPLNSAIGVEQVQAGLSADTSGSRKSDELLALESAGKANLLALQLNKAAYLPKLSTFLDLGAQGDFLKVNDESPYYLFGVTLSWQIFAGNQRKNKIQQASMDVKSANNQVSQAEQRLQLEIETAANKLKAAIQVYDASVSQASLSRQYFKDQQRLYKEGQALYLELLDAQARLINDELKQSITYLTAQTRAAELERAKSSYTF